MVPTHFPPPKRLPLRPEDRYEERDQLFTPERRLQQQRDQDEIVQQAPKRVGEMDKLKPEIDCSKQKEQDFRPSQHFRDQVIDLCWRSCRE